MFLHWTVFALLLILPHPINGDDNKELGENEASCSNAMEADCGNKEGEKEKCTIVCFQLNLCQYFQNTHLLLTAAAFLTVNKEGRITEQFVNNKYIASKIRETSGTKTAMYFTLKISAPLNEVHKKVASFTDLILYVGSDYADHYDPPNYGYDPANLQLRDAGTTRPDNLYQRSLFGIHRIYGLYPRSGSTSSSWNEIINIHYSGEDNTRFYFSTPGIYRLKMDKSIPEGKHISLLYYDPIRAGVLE